MKVSFKGSGDMLRHDEIQLAAKSPGVVRDENGVPVEWTLFKVGENPTVQNGQSGNLPLSAADTGTVQE